jgi:hypothetical protein
LVASTVRACSPETRMATRALHRVCSSSASSPQHILSAVLAVRNIRNCSDMILSSISEWPPRELCGPRNCTPPHTPLSPVQANYSPPLSLPPALPFAPSILLGHSPEAWVRLTNRDFPKASVPRVSQISPVVFRFKEIVDWCRTHLLLLLSCFDARVTTYSKIRPVLCFFRSCGCEDELFLAETWTRAGGFEFCSSGIQEAHDPQTDCTGL